MPSTRSIAIWIGIVVVSVAILFIPIWNGAIQAAERANPHWFSFQPGARLERTPVPSTDKDCPGYFESRRHAQRFFIEHGGPEKDAHHLDPDGDGTACEHFDY